MKTLLLQINWSLWKSSFHLIPLTYKSSIAGFNARIFDFWIFRLTVFKGSLPEYIASMNAEERRAELTLSEWESISKNE